MSTSESLPAQNPWPAPRTRARIDWKRGAALLIEGETPTAVAAALGIAEERLWTHLRRSLRFQFLLRQARERRRLLGRLRFEAVSTEAALRGTLQVESADGETLKWLAGESGLGSAEADKTNDVIARLSDTGRRPPNQALHKRIAAERKVMDAQVAEARRLFAARYPELVQAPDPVKAAVTPAVASSPPDTSLPDAPPAPDKPEMVPDKMEFDSHKTELDSNKPKLDSNKPELDAAKTGLAPDRAPSPSLRPRPPTPPMQGSPAFVDLTDMQGRPLPGRSGAG